MNCPLCGEVHDWRFIAWVGVDARRRIKTIYDPVKDTEQEEIARLAEMMLLGQKVRQVIDLDFVYARWGTIVMVEELEASTRPAVSSDEKVIVKTRRRTLGGKVSARART